MSRDDLLQMANTVINEAEKAQEYAAIGDLIECTVCLQSILWMLKNRQGSLALKVHLIDALAS